MLSPHLDDRAQQLLASEVARWRALRYEDLTPLVGMNGRTVLDEATELALAVSVGWEDAQHHAVRIRVGVEARLPLSVCRIEQAVIVAMTEPMNGPLDEAGDSAADHRHAG